MGKMFAGLLSLAFASSVLAATSSADYWNGSGTCQYGWRYSGGHAWLGRHGCSNDWMCRDGNPNTWDRCVAGDGYDDDRYGRCTHGWRGGSGWWWSHERCRTYNDCLDGNSNTWDFCALAPSPGGSLP